MEHVLTVIAPPGSASLSRGQLDAAREAVRSLGAIAGSPRWLKQGEAADIPFEDIAVDAAEAAARQALDGAALDLVAQAQAARRVAMLKGLPESALAETHARIAPMPGAAALVATMKAHGAYAALVSGGFRYFTGRVAASLGFDLDQGNELVIEEGVLAGRVAEPILDKDAKLATLRTLAASRGLTLAETLAVGDGANDLPMLQAAGLGVAYHAKPMVAAASRVRIDHGDLTALLWAQGYAESEIVTPA